MNLYEVIQTRRSVRQYKATPVPQATLDRIWEAARLAPSACNFQPWRFLLVQSPEARGCVQEVLPEWTQTAPLLVVALGSPAAAWKRDGQSVHEIDVAIAMEHLMLAATAEGLGTCWICAFNRKRLAHALKLPKDWEPVAVTPLGYPDDSSPRTSRKPLAEIVQEI
jgi:nitroreductase